MSVIHTSNVVLYSMDQSENALSTLQLGQATLKEARSDTAKIFNVVESANALAREQTGRGKVSGLESQPENLYQLENLRKRENDERHDE